MIGDLFINGKDAYTQWGISMVDNFIPDLKAPAPMKEFIENQSRLEHGKRVFIKDPRLASREVTLTFHLKGDTPQEYEANYDSFIEELYKVRVNIKVPAIGNQTYKLLYQKHASFAQNYKRTSGKLSVKFEEPNPAERK